MNMQEIIQAKIDKINADFDGKVAAIEGFKAMALEATVKLKEAQDAGEFQLLNLFKPKG